MHVFFNTHARFALGEICKELRSTTSLFLRHRDCLVVIISNEECVIVLWMPYEGYRRYTTGCTSNFRNLAKQVKKSGAPCPFWPPCHYSVMCYCIVL